MKVILLKDVKALGRALEVKEVSDGHAANYLLPNKLAIAATPGSLKANAERKKKEEEKNTKQRQQLQALSDRISSLNVKLEVESGEGGKLFGAITNKDIAEALAKQFAVEIDRHHIELERPLKHIGEHVVRVKLAADITPKLKVNIQAK